MKYMGSKRAMLQNGLGQLLHDEISKSKRFVDLFTGSSAVASFAAIHHPIEVKAFDLQSYGVVLAEATLGRTQPVDGDAIWASWEKRASSIASKVAPPTYKKLSRNGVVRLRKWSEEQEDLLLTSAYGGHYFSPTQSSMLDALLKALPPRPSEKTLALASLIEAASVCAAAPGHTAQPFQPTETAMPFLEEAWSREVAMRVRSALKAMAQRSAKKLGSAAVCDANLVAHTLKNGDLVFIDPPYSGVHYSRFYHVLETIARGECGAVSGAGRYPSSAERPTSRYSIGSQSAAALDELLSTLASKGVRAILTFPDHACSNGLSGEQVIEIASIYFKVRRKTVKSRFSTLGGNRDASKPQGPGRAARHPANELILVLDSR